MRLLGLIGHPARLHDSLRPHLLERHSAPTIALIGGVIAVLSSVLVSHFCIWVTGFQPSSWLFITTMMILCPALIAQPMIYFYAKALHEVARQRRALQEANTKLEAALGEVRELSGLLPICAWCDKVRDDEGYWNRVDAFLKKHTRAQITHSICPACRSQQFASLIPKN